jgi:hypothetical protein
MKLFLFANVLSHQGEKINFPDNTMLHIFFHKNDKRTYKQFSKDIDKYEERYRNLRNLSKSQGMAEHLTNPEYFNNFIKYMGKKGYIYYLPKQNQDSKYFLTVVYKTYKLLEVSNGKNTKLIT